MDIGIENYQRVYWEIGRNLKEVGINSFSLKKIPEKGKIGKKSNYQLMLLRQEGERYVTNSIIGRHPFHILGKLKSLLNSLH